MQQLLFCFWVCEWDRGIMSSHNTFEEFVSFNTVLVQILPSRCHSLFFVVLREHFWHTPTTDFVVTKLLSDYFVKNISWNLKTIMSQLAYCETPEPVRRHVARARQWLVKVGHFGLHHECLYCRQWTSDTTSALCYHSSHFHHTLCSLTMNFCRT